MLVIFILSPQLTAQWQALRKHLFSKDIDVAGDPTTDGTCGREIGFSKTCVGSDFGDCCGADGKCVDIHPTQPLSPLTY